MSRITFHYEIISDKDAPMLLDLLLFVFLISSILHRHPALLHRHTLILDRFSSFLVAFSTLVLRLSCTQSLSLHIVIYPFLRLISY